MKRPLVIAAFACAAMLALGGSAHAAPKPGAGCNGLNNAAEQGKAGTNGKTRVAELAAARCEPPPPVDDMACPVGQSELSAWTWNGSAFVATSTSTSPSPFGDPGGFWTENGTPVSIVIKSTTGEVVTIDYAALVAENGGAVSQNKLVDRTGIQHIRYCG